jgi:hypothetical protein
MTARYTNAKEPWKFKNGNAPFFLLMRDEETKRGSTSELREDQEEPWFDRPFADDDPS